MACMSGRLKPSIRKQECRVPFSISVVLDLKLIFLNFYVDPRMDFFLSNFACNVKLLVYLL